MMISKKTHVELKLERNRSLGMDTTTKSGTRLPEQLECSFDVLCPRRSPYPRLARLSMGSLTCILFMNPTQFR